MSTDAQTAAHILVVEDEPSMQVLLRHHLTRAGFRVTLVPNGLDAKEILLKQQFDLICSDVMMSGVDGIELCGWAKERDDLKDIPFILLSSRAQNMDKEVGIDAGADVYLTKPFDVQELVNTLKRLTGQTA